MGYSGFWGSFKTLFMIHNETTNVWTHLSGMIIFLGVVALIHQYYPNLHPIGKSGLEEYDG